MKTVPAFETYSDAQWLDIVAAFHGGVEIKGMRDIDEYRKLLELYGTAYRENVRSTEKEEEAALRREDKKGLNYHVRQARRLALLIYPNDRVVTAELEQFERAVESAEHRRLTGIYGPMFMNADGRGRTSKKARRWYMECVFHLWVRDPRTDLPPSQLRAWFHELFASIARPVLIGEDAKLIEKNEIGSYDLLRKEIKNLEKTGYITALHAMENQDNAL